VARQAGRNGRKRVTIADVAERAGVSVPTVSRVLAGNYPVAQPTRTKVQRAIRELDYVANAHARALAGATTKTVAFVVHDIVSPFFAHIAQGVEEQARQEGRTCLVSTSSRGVRSIKPGSRRTFRRKSGSRRLGLRSIDQSRSSLVQ
jgi:LacI family transcriptional regulator